ncbi:carbohydrate sulfotransferase 11-like isoform X2 [Zootermopsis nevadensis]|uniref:carbohydrate sulfotransferase 11-like isoform X2 n=1 Tax=Zootermopsis nevadensis TaxID=136037 RepID=UPI000B8ECD55|nr:carbohydrate sulfotransferase 11-like isoform X2 [Zootermopsis nevadensis]
MNALRPQTAQTFHPEETKNICSQVKVDLRLPQRRHFLVNHEHKLLYCWIHKVASTSWIALFSHLANRTHIDEYYREIRILSPKSAEELHGIITTKDYYKLIVVRHPFERLVSAYRDRIEDTSRFTSQAWIYVPRIFALTRPVLNRNKIFDINHNQKLSIVPTFQEFVEWLLVIPPKKYDVHWNRYSDHCKPCAIHYDAIIKMENFSNEKEVSVMHNMELELLNASLPHLQRTSGGPTDYNITCQYFQQLFSEQVSALYEIYSMDFEMFHYSPQLYINCAQNKSGQTDLSVPNATP